MTVDPDRRERLAESTWDWILFREPDGRLVLSVLCGTVALWEQEIELGPELAAAWEAGDLEPIRKFARQVTDNPWAFRGVPSTP